jgi:hypothetical protein
VQTVLSQPLAKGAAAQPLALYPHDSLIERRPPMAPHSEVSDSTRRIAIAVSYVSATTLGKSTVESRLSEAISQPRRKSTMCLRIQRAASSELPPLIACVIFSCALSMRPLD